MRVWHRDCHGDLKSIKMNKDGRLLAVRGRTALSRLSAGVYKLVNLMGVAMNTRLREALRSNGIDDKVAAVLSEYLVNLEKTVRYICWMAYVIAFLIAGIAVVCLYIADDVSFWFPTLAKHLLLLGGGDESAKSKHRARCAHVVYCYSDSDIPLRYRRFLCSRSSPQ